MPSHGGPAPSDSGSDEDHQSDEDFCPASESSSDEESDDESAVVTLDDEDLAYDSDSENEATRSDDNDLVETDHELDDSDKELLQEAAEERKERALHKEDLPCMRDSTMSPNTLENDHRTFPASKSAHA